MQGRAQQFVPCTHTSFVVKATFALRIPSYAQLKLASCSINIMFNETKGIERTWPISLGQSSLINTFSSLIQTQRSVF